MSRERKDSDRGRRSAARELGPVLDFMQRLWAVVHELQSISKRMDATLGVTGPQRLVIRILGRRPGLSAGELAAIMHVHPSTLTGVLRRLQARALVERRVDPGDARRVLLHLTTSGRRLDQKRIGTVEDGIERALARLGRRQATSTGAALKVVMEELRLTSGL